VSTPYWRSVYAQTNLFGSNHRKKLTRESVAVLVGQFFEQLTGAIFADTDVDSYLNAGDDRPDIIAWHAGPRDGDLLIEVKASSSGHLFDADQLQAYQALCRQRFPWDRPRLFYALWLYRGEQLWTTADNVSGLLDHLRSSVEALYLLPGAVVGSLVEAIGAKTYESWRGSKRSSAGHYARLSRLQHHILRWGRPEAIRTVAHLLDVSLDGWRVTRTEVHTAELVGRPVESFPVVCVAKFPLKHSLRK
jgi:hypothetical protein